jgi:type IV pilus assembly protein PilA
MRLKGKGGFTLTELLIAVAIVGILAAVAITGYRAYIRRALTSEAIAFVSEIKAKQESYRAEFGVYCNVSQNCDNWYPDFQGVPRGSTAAWDPPPESGWRQLGARPEGGRVHFAYQTIAGLPGTNVPGGCPDWNLNVQDHWFAVRARGDLDFDETAFSFYETHNQMKGVAVINAGE